ncbi:hypothetical protein EKL98_01080 [Flavobacterium bomense]|uniref:DNA gyrase subunit A n=1 Tax=Flavobacterium bomense TaxID=2497483 RepID=A0A3S0MGC5_9FLAO|nr:DNA gyrase C-terminal beta-propeller domain-containing protein [Flavobacterium bomense]RTZ07943.1 hypothetical protein EKL98_01080 [Flavobacterium bomense]
MEENNKSLISANNSLAKIEKQIAIGDKILEKANQSFILLISKDFLFQIISLNDYKNLTANLILNKKTKNIFIENLITIELVTRTSKIIFFTKFGKYFSTSIDKILKIKDLNDLFNIEIQDELLDVILIDEKTNNIENKFLIFATRNGFVKSTIISLYCNESLTNDIAIRLKENDSLINVKIADYFDDQIVIGSKHGKLVRFSVYKIRPLSKNTYGYIGLKLEEENNIVIGLSIIDSFDDCIFIITEKGKIKKSSIDEYRITNRGGQGVKTANITNNTGFMSHLKTAKYKDICLIITNLNNMIVFEMFNVKMVGRASEAIKIIKLIENEQIHTIVKLPNINQFS